jgi:Flp pilus assembly protein TadD
MSPLFGIDLGVWIGMAGIAIALIGSIAAFFYWKGGLDQWKKSVDEWRNSVDNRFDKLVENINTLMSDVAVIKSASEKDATRNGMIQRRSPLVPSEKAIEILEELNILSQVDANISYIQEEIEKRSRTSIYRDIEDPEERFIEIAPGVIHALIKKGKIDEKKIDGAMKELEKIFPVVTYYGVLLLIAAYILEKGKEKGFTTKPSMIYSQIDMAGLKDRDELLASFDGNAEKAIKSLEMSIRTLEEVGNKKELVENKFVLALIQDYIGRTEEAEKEYKEAIRINPNLAEVHNNLGNLLYKLKRFGEAEKEYKEAVRINPDHAKAHNNLGILLYNLKRFEEAEEEYKEAVRINPDYAEAHNNHGNLLSDLKRFEEAEKKYRKAIELKDNLPDKGAKVHNNLGVLLYDLKRFEEVEKEFKEAIRVNPNLAEAHNNFGVLLGNLKRFEEAKKELEIAKRLFEAQGREEDVKKAEELLSSLKL